MLDVGTFQGWPSGDSKPVIEIAMTPTQIEERYGLKFAKGKDDLDRYVGLHYLDPDLGPVVLMQYENSPAKGVIIHVDASIDSVKASRRVKEILRLSSEDIHWCTSSGDA